MNHLPKIGSLVVEHEVNDDCGIDRFNLYRMINSVIDSGVEVYILKSDKDAHIGNEYIAVTHSEFENTFLSYLEGFNDEVLEPRMKIIDLDSKPLKRINRNQGSAIFVTINVYTERYDIEMPEKSSDRVFADICERINDLITADTFKKYLGECLKFKVKWDKTDYKWERIYS